jgi:hypothetical protein
MDTIEFVGKYLEIIAECSFGTIYSDLSPATKRDGTRQVSD